MRRGAILVLLAWSAGCVVSEVDLGVRIGCETEADCPEGQGCEEGICAGRAAPAEGEGEGEGGQEGEGSAEGEGEGEPVRYRVRLQTVGWSSPVLVSARHRASLVSGRPVSGVAAVGGGYRLEWRGVPRLEVQR